MTIESATLDLGGFSILCTDASQGRVRLVGRKGRLANGAVVNCGVVVEGQDHTVERVRALDAGFWLTRKSRAVHLVDNIATRSAALRAGTLPGPGFTVEGKAASLTGNTASGWGAGFSISGVGHTLEANLAEMNVHDCHGVGFEVVGRNHALRGNLARDNGVAPNSLRCSGARAAPAGSGFAIGYRPSKSCCSGDYSKTASILFDDNSALSNLGNGVTCPVNRLVIRNTVSRGNGSVGIAASGSRIEHSTAEDNGSDGMYAGDVRDSAARRNGGSGVRVLGALHGVRAQVSDSVSEDNYEYGIAAIHGTPVKRVPGDGAKIKGCTVAGNRLNGIFLKGADRLLVQGNIVRDNGGNGIAIANEQDDSYIPPVDEARKNRVIGNHVSGHAPHSDLLDLADSQCSSNKWMGNTFATRAPECLQ